MSKGLKQMVGETLAELAEQPAIKPMRVSGEAHRALALKMREWSGWPNATLRFGNPMQVLQVPSDIASCDHLTRTFTVNVDSLSRNPNRVLVTVTPFRLRQEAVLTGVMLHESGHARHSHWFRDKDGNVRTDLVHGSGSVHEGEPVTMQTLGLARLLEEPRVEGLMARNADRIGASGLAWTMRASGADLLPYTRLAANPQQALMDLITSWALRAGKQISYGNWVPGHTLPTWVSDFNNLLHGAIVAHLSENTDSDDPDRDAAKVLQQLVLMACSVDDRGTYMLDSARDILDILFPETSGEDQPGQPVVGSGCAEQMQADGGTQGESDEEGTEGEGNTEPEDEGSGDDPGAGDSGPGSEDDEAQGSEGNEDDEAQGSEDESDEDDEADDAASPSSADSTSDAAAESELAKALAALEGSAKDETEGEAEEQVEALKEGGGGAGAGGDGSAGSGWRQPTKDEREIQHGAERFLRTMIEPSEAGKVLLNDSPSAVVDGAAYEEWRNGGMIHEPMFFKHIRRTVEPSPPVKIAVLVDRSGSMDELQAPSALLSWALASAALDLRNFAGRGVQIESTLIHWGSTADVIQRNGEVLPGIREYACWEGTDAMHEAMELVEQELPGFFDPGDRPENRLLVQFTDWELWAHSSYETIPWLDRALSAGVNMLTVAPRNYSVRRSSLPKMLEQCKVQRGKTSLLKYNPMFPEQVWDTASEMLDGLTPAPFAGF